MRMLSIVGSILLWLSGVVVATAQSLPSLVVDPLFLIEYNPAKVHFESIPSIIPKQCPRLRDFYAEAWVYGHLKTPDAEYFIVYGYTKVPTEEHPGSYAVVPEEDDGLAVELRNQSCRMDQAQFFLREKINPAKKATPIAVPDSVLDAIAEDIIDRYAKAFGGNENFLRRVTPLARNDVPPVVRKQLAKLEQRQ